MTWTIHFENAASLLVRDGELDFDYATGEDVEGDPPPRYAELMHFQNLAARLREFGAGFDGEIVPIGISARHKRHLATVVVRQYQTLCDDLTALVGRCRNQTGGADVAFALRESEDGSQGFDAVFTDGSKVLTAYSEQFADAAKWADATTLIEPVRAHFVPPDDEAAYQAHKTARETAHRNATCDAMEEAALVEMKASYGAWTLWPPE